MILRQPKNTNKLVEAHRVLDTILWDREPRAKLCDASMARARKEYGSLLKEYIEVSIKNGRMICLHVLDRVVDSRMNLVGPQPLVKDLEIHRTYAEAIIKMWTLTQAVTSPKCDRYRVRFEQHAIGMLYRLRMMSIIKDGVVIVPQDPWLARNLPQQNDLHHFKPKTGTQVFVKNDITKGIKNLVMSLLHCGISGEQLAARF